MTYRGRNAARRACKEARKTAERAELIAKVKASCAAEAKVQLRDALARRPYRVPTAALLGFESELTEILAPIDGDQEKPMRSEDGREVVWFFGKAPESLEVLVPIDLGMAMQARSVAGIRDDSLLAELMTRRQLMTGHFVARPQRWRVAPGTVVQWWNWEPKRGGHYSAAATLHRHLGAARSYLSRTIEAFRYNQYAEVAYLAQRAGEALERGLAGVGEWIGAEEP
jgi:hypothetical protein